MSRLGKKKNTDSRDLEHIPDRRPISSRLGKRNTTYIKEQMSVNRQERIRKNSRSQDIRDEECEDDDDETTETESDDKHSRN